MTNSFVTGGIVVANALAVVTLAAAELNPFIEYIQHADGFAKTHPTSFWVLHGTEPEETDHL